MNALPAPSTPNKSFTAASAMSGFATASAMRPGDTFTIRESDSGFVEFDFVEPARGVRPDHRVRVSIHRAGIPALIAELQRLMGETS